MQEHQATGQGWFVSDGLSVIGPIGDDDLLAGAAVRRWGETSLVWMHPWSEWRSIEAVREIKALRLAQHKRGARWVPPRGWSADESIRYRMNRACTSIAMARGDDEVVSLALRALMVETRATVGLVHRTESALAEIETWCAADRAPLGQIDSAMEGADADALRAVCPGSYVIAVGNRTQGVALVPIYATCGLFAVLELAKHDRPFRHSDSRWFEAIGDRASARLM
jgi:hypothetical protein